MSDSNRAKGLTSRDAQVGNVLVEFVNRNVMPYPTEVGGPKFDLVPVTQQKDLMINRARLHARQEYDRIMELVAVLQRQADDVRRRLDVTDLVHAAHYNFQVYAGQCYWLAHDHQRGGTILCLMGPADWATAKPEHYEYICRVRYLGDHTWTEVDHNGDCVL